MFWAFVSNILASIDTIYYKKALSVSSISNLLFSWFGELPGIIISIVLVVFLGFDKTWISWTMIGGIVLIILMATSYDYFDQLLFKKEKISDIIPYSNLNTIFSIIFGFVIFKDSSIISFIISIIAFFVILLFSIDFKKLTLPKSIKYILIVQIMMTIETLFIGLLLKDTPDKEFYVMYEIVVVLILFLPILYKGLFSELKNIKKVFYGYIFGGSLAGNLSFLLYLFMVGEFGVVLSILFSFIGTGITLLFGYLFLKEKPSKKDIWMTIIVTALVAIGFIFK